MIYGYTSIYRLPPFLLPDYKVHVSMIVILYRTSTLFRSFHARDEKYWPDCAARGVNVGCAGCGMRNDDALCFINSGAVEVEWSTEQIRRV
jgi:hypothetical protein